MNRRITVTLAALSTACFAEQDATMTDAEVREAMNQIVITSRSDAFAGEVVELSTGFTLGAAVEESVENLRAFYESQIPCSTVSVEDRTVTLDFGDLGDACVHNGRTYAGVQTLTVARQEQGEVTVEHGFDGVTDGWTVLDGAATVAWSAGDKTRTITHDATWTTPLSALDAQGERTQSLLDEEAGVAGGIRIDGDRTWQTDDGGQWDLLIDGVEVQWDDPVPQAGQYVLSNPADKQLTATFSRIDEDTIEVLLESGARSQVVEVSRTGEVTEAE